MTTFVLVHGSFTGGWIWQPTLNALRQAGHSVYAPSQEGCGERKGALREGLSVTAAASELAELMFYEDLRDVVLVGTSTGGLIVEKLATLASDRIKHIVLLDALVPMPGESIRNIVQRPNAPPFKMNELSREPTREDMINGLFAEITGELQEWVMQRSTPHPLGLSDAQPGELDEFWKQQWPVTVIRCTNSPNPPESHQRRTAETLKARFVELEAGHYPMLTHPEQTAKLLQEC
ncbi:MAG: pimeloyl-ACP methyl ester carboxylesterase [Gammaproteobacteria bacterium]|jgi:pimeloyl-ACP methyl ester carboxylesterase